MDHEPRPNKRPRATSVDSVDVVSPTTGLEKSEEYWYEDGNIILRVEDVLFRVYGGMLSRHSAVFRDMFSIPQPTTPEDDMEFMEGCPVVVLFGDAAEEWEHLLRVLCDYDMYVMSFSITTSLHKVYTDMNPCFLIVLS